MRTAIYIYSEQSSPAILREGRDGLEDDLSDFLGEAGAVTGGGGGDGSWNIDLELAGDAEIWISAICVLLRKWGVAEETYLDIYPEDWDRETEPRQVKVFDE